jgi:hypothetical protein
MSEHIYKKFDNDFIKSILSKYLDKEFNLKYALDILKIKKSRFYILLKTYKADPDKFDINYKHSANNKISNKLETIIIDELKEEKKLIDNKDIPIKNYNYTYLKDQILKKFNLKISTPTIINRAKKNNYYILKKRKKKHDREVLTNYPGELIQHYSSFHMFSPYADKKWYLITSIDDYSRYLLYADLIEKETSWTHILALERVFLTNGLPYSYYTDCHSIFRFVQGRDSVYRNHKKTTDDIVTQFKQVLCDFNVDLKHALSPQAKGKVERPYQWLQDRIVRTCARENIKNITEARKVLKYEVYRYNNRQVHSTTKEIPELRFKNAIKNNKSMFRSFKLPYPYENTKDLFCIRMQRKTDGYRKIQLKKIELRIKNAPTHDYIDIKIVLENKTGMSELRFWYRYKLLDIIKVKNEDIDIFHF